MSSAIHCATSAVRVAAWTAGADGMSRSVPSTTVWVEAWPCLLDRAISRPQTEATMSPRAMRGSNASVTQA